MSSVSLPLPAVASFPASKQASRTSVIRRRPSRQQGAALEMLGHAIEYLVDEHGFVLQESAAFGILMRASQEVFQECREVVPFGTRLRRRLHLC